MLFPKNNFKGYKGITIKCVTGKYLEGIIGKMASWSNIKRNLLNRTQKH